MKLVAENTCWAQKLADGLHLYYYLYIFIYSYSAVIQRKGVCHQPRIVFMSLIVYLTCFLPPDITLACLLSALWFSAYSSEASPMCLDLNCLSDIGSVLPSLPALLLNWIVYPNHCVLDYIPNHHFLAMVRFKSWISLCKFTESVIIVSTLCVIPCFYCIELSPLYGPAGKPGPSKGTTAIPHFPRGSRLVRVWVFHNNLVGNQSCRVTIHYSVVLLKHVKEPPKKHCINVC